MPPFARPQDDPLNELIREPTKEQPLSQVLADLRRTHEQLLAVVAALPEADLERLAADYQPEELAGDTDSIADWIAHICDEHLRDHVGWIQRSDRQQLIPDGELLLVAPDGPLVKEWGRGIPRPLISTSRLVLPTSRLPDSVPTD